MMELGDDDDDDDDDDEEEEEEEEKDHIIAKNDKNEEVHTNKDEDGWRHNNNNNKKKKGAGNPCVLIGMLVAHTLVLQVMLEGMGAAWKKPKNKNKQQQQQGSSKYSLSFSLSWWELLYGLGLVGVQLFQSVIHPIFFAHLAFLPLLLWSTYCAFGIVTAAVLYYFCLL
eukprot:jgi/Bigna1/139885/aug1.53_g14593